MNAAWVGACRLVAAKDNHNLSTSQQHSKR